MDPRPGPVPQPSAPFSHAELDHVLRRFVDDQGRVDYAALVREPESLERYYALLGEVSPDSDPHRFPDDASRLAYWINAYNGSVLKMAKDHYPIASVEDVRSPAPLFFLPGKFRFFGFNRILLGGSRMSLYQLENGIVRERFPDPRIHFALNCASLGCPKLPRTAFDSARLEEQLEREARAFVAEPRNFEIQHEARTVWLSAIFDWYESDFTSWVQRRSGGSERTLLEAVAHWLPADRAAALRERAAGYRVRFRPYDWRLNDRTTLPKEDA